VIEMVVTTYALASEIMLRKVCSGKVARHFQPCIGMEDEGNFFLRV